MKTFHAAMNDGTEPSLRHPILRERLGASRVRFAPLAADAPLTRPARSLVFGNYRSDTAIRSDRPGVCR